MNNNDLFRRVKEIRLPPGRYALFGSAPMGIRGLKVCQDADIIVTENLWDEYMNKGWEIKTMPHGSRYLRDNKIELWKDWYPGNWDIGQLIREAEMIDALPFVKLETVLKWKKAAARENDLKDIDIIEEYLRKTN